MTVTDSRQRILDAATELFLGGSYHVVGIAEICDRADVNRGTFYHFFPSKIALLLEVLERYVGAVVAEYDSISSSSETPQQKMHRIFMIPRRWNEDWKAEHGIASGCLIGNVCLELASREPAVREKTDWAFKTLSKGLEPIVAELLANPNCTPAELSVSAQTVMGLMQGAQVIAKSRNDPALFDDYAQLSIDMLAMKGRGLGDQLRASA